MVSKVDLPLRWDCICDLTWSFLLSYGNQMNRPTELRQVSNDKKFRIDLILHIHFLKINKVKVETYLTRLYTRHKMRPRPSCITPLSAIFTKVLRTNGQTNGPTGQRTNGRTNGQTVTPSYRDARIHLKILTWYILYSTLLSFSLCLSVWIFHY